jgi:methylated-DNA-[protein]-cysteine S-methyltransferase
MTDTHYAMVPSPLGDLLITSDSTALTRLYLPSDRRTPASQDPSWKPVSDAVLTETARQLTAYFAGELTEFDLPLAAAGTEFQHKVWAALCAIPYGTTATYGEIAAKIGAPTASRAVGLANGRNPIAIVVPCHRVIGANGSLTGYAGGLATKQHLLALESGLPLAV